jgi:hypothetical protein
MGARIVLALVAVCVGLAGAPRLGWAEEAGDEPAAAGEEATAETGDEAEAPVGTEGAGDEAEAPVGTEETDPGQYSVRLRDLETRINVLQEQIFRSKARLNLLKETVLHGVIAGSRAVVTFKNEMGSAFKLTRAVFAVDGVQVKALADESGKLNEADKFEIFNGAIVPGPHTLMVMLVYQGSGFGVFNYFKGYKFTVRSSHTFTAGEGKLTEITIRGFEKGNITTPLAERPAVDFKINVLSERAPAKK